MSYCRFSSNNFACDVYVYEDVAGGWTTHVAARKQRWPLLPLLLSAGRMARMSIWAGGRWDREARKVVYEHPRRGAVFGAVLRLSGLWEQGPYRLWRSLTPLVPIGLPHDGEQFSDASPAECADRLESLRALGYRVPQRAIDRLRQEAQEAQEAQEGAPA